MLEPYPGRLVGVAVEADDRPTMIAEAWQRLVEESLNEHHPLLQAETGEMVPHFFDRYGKEVNLAQVQLVVLGKRSGVGLRQATEGVGHPDGAIVGPQRVEGRAGEDRSSTPPRPGLDHIALDPVGD